MNECNPALSPKKAKSSLQRQEMAYERKMNKYPYQNLIGALMFLAVTTRPYIAYAVNFMSQFNANYNVEHWNIAKRILRYLRAIRSC